MSLLHMVCMKVPQIVSCRNISKMSIDKTRTIFHFYIENINITAYEELQLQQGDMIPDPSYGRAGHKARRWPNGVLSYIIHDSLGRYMTTVVQTTAYK